MRGGSGSSRCDGRVGIMSLLKLEAWRLTSLELADGSGYLLHKSDAGTSRQSHNVRLDAAAIIYATTAKVTS